MVPAVLSALAVPPLPTRAAAAAPHVMVVVEENREYPEVIGNPSAPYVNSLASQYGLATQAYATTHPSLPNYLELIAGTTFGITDDCTACSVEGTTLVDQLQAAGLDWRAYMEGVPGPCYGGAFTSAGYAKKHDPFMYVRHIAGNPGECGRVVPFSQLASDLAAGASGPAFMWVTPNLCDDGHDCSTQTMDSWLANNLPGVLSSSWYQEGGAVIVTWDEGTTSVGCCGGASGGHVATVVVSASTRGGVTLPYAVDHAGTLRTIEDMYGLSHLGHAACACSGELRPQVTACPPGSPPVARGSGYRMVGSDGGVFDFGAAPFCGSEGGIALDASIVGMAQTGDGLGYWLAAQDGGVFAFGDAGFWGSMGGRALHAPVVGIAATPDGRGYWLVASDGGVFALGDAVFLGSMGGHVMNAPVVGTAATPDGGGYWLVASDGGVFAFGDAAFHGSLGGQPSAAPVVGMAA